MIRAESLPQFLADPVGHYFRGRRHLAFVHSPTLIGLKSWGYPEADDVRELLELCEIGLRPEFPPHRFLADVRSLEFIDPRTFGMFVDYTRKNGEVLGRKIVRQAQLRPDGLVGAIISGFSRIAKLPYPERVFGDVDKALAWLDVDHDTGVELLLELEAIRNEACESFDVVERLRATLDESGALAVNVAARRLGYSTRSLQRALRNAGSSYRLELKSFRVRRAQQLLRTSERSLAEIASEVGFASAQHFNTAYRRLVGQTPAAWRKRQNAK